MDAVQTQNKDQHTARVVLENHHHHTQSQTVVLLFEVSHCSWCSVILWQNQRNKEHQQQKEEEEGIHRRPSHQEVMALMTTMSLSIATRPLPLVDLCECAAADNKKYKTATTCLTTTTTQQQQAACPRCH